MFTLRGGKIISMKAIKPTAYIRFLNYLDSLDRINSGKKLDSTEEQLLNRITLANSQGKDLLAVSYTHLTLPTNREV